MKTKRPKHKKWIKLVEKFNSISYSNSEDVRYKAMFYGAALGILRVLDVYEDYFLMGQDKVIEILSDTNTHHYTRLMFSIRISVIILNVLRNFHSQ